jgi:hypothetical protein
MTLGGRPPFGYPSCEGGYREYTGNDAHHFASYRRIEERGSGRGLS